MSNKTRFVRPKDGVNVSTARSSSSGSAKPKIYVATSVFQAEDENNPETFTSFPSVSLNVPFTQSQTLLIRGQIEPVTSWSGVRGELYFKPFNEYSPPGNAVPKVPFWATNFYKKVTSISGVLSIDAEVTSSPYTLTLEGTSVNDSDPSEVGYLYVAMKLVVIVGDYTGANSIHFDGL